MKIQKLFYLLFCLVLLASCSTSKHSTQKRDNKSVTYKKESTKASKEAQKIINYASKFKGTPHRLGGTTPTGFDCSGFVQYVYRNFNYHLPRTSNEQSKIGKNIKKNRLNPGDLVFFATGKSKSTVNHVGIVVAAYTDGSFQFIHVASSRGVTEDFSNIPYWNSRYLRGRRVLR
jgi:cell wall-associated NlpC family hydrolase